MHRPAVFLKAALLLALALGLGRFAPAAETIPLQGRWAFRLDPQNAGAAQKWFNQTLPDTIALPGSTDEAKKGPPNATTPTLNYLYRLYPYAGAAWYQREIEIPEAWRGKRVTLTLERCHWETRAWLDGRPLGMQESLCVAHVYDLGASLTPGKHRLTLRIDNTLKYEMGPDAHSTSEQTQTNWNGAIGRIELAATDPVWIDAITVYPDLAKKSARVRLRLGNALGRPVSGKITLQARLRGQRAPQGAPQGAPAREVAFTAGAAPTELEAELPMGKDVKQWDEFSPNLYDLTAALSAGFLRSEARTTFGMRALGVTSDKKQMTLNGRPIFIRGTLDCCIYPKTGYPPTDVASWLRTLKVCQSYGLNHVRFHSWCPPEAAFAAADQLGILFHVELPCWIHNYTAPGTEARDKFLEAELRRILETYGNHPSFGMLCMGNEPGPRDRLDFIHGLVKLGKSLDPRHLYISGAGWGFGPDDDYHVTSIRGVRGPKTDHDFREQDASHPVPVVSHEIGQWTVYPNLDEMKKYTGVVRARNFELVRDDLKAKGLLGQAADFTRASGLQMVELYKEEIEVLLRTPGHGGFQLLDLHDFPGQGTALIGILDPFWDSKGFVKPEEWKRFCGPITPLLRMPKRAYTTDEAFEAAAEVAQFGPADLKDAAATWTIKDEQGATIAQGAFNKQTYPTGKLSLLGEIKAPLAKAAAPAKLTVTVMLPGAQASNSWNIWVYPPKVELAAPKGLTVAHAWSDEVKAKLAGGGKVLLLTRGNAANSLPGSFTPVFWSPVWFKRGAGTMSILCDPKHPALAQFPTARYSDWQWHDLLSNSRTLILDELPQGFRPVVQMIDNFARNHRLGNVLEAQVGPGKLLVCSIDLEKKLEERPAARQLLKSLQDYAGSDAFAPKQALSVEALEKLFAGKNAAAANIAGAAAESFEPDYEADKALDGDLATMWHTAFRGEQVKGYPHSLEVEFIKPQAIGSVGVLPRQDGNHNGRIREYELYVSEDGKTWGAPAARGELKNSGELQTIKLEKPVQAKRIKLVARSGFDRQTHTAIAELTISAQ